MDSILNVRYGVIARFLEATKGNYRNAIYIECHNCTFEHTSKCQDFLFIPGHDCIPILLPVHDAGIFLGEPIDRSDCSGIMTNHVFTRLYQKWLELTTSSDEVCPLRHLLGHTHFPNI